MGQNRVTLTVFVCDNCGTEQEYEGIDGLTPAFPVSWLRIDGAPSVSDVFCSWECLADYAARTGKEKKAAAEARAKERKALAEAAKKKGGVV